MVVPLVPDIDDNPDKVLESMFVRSNRCLSLRRCWPVAILRSQTSTPSPMAFNGRLISLLQLKELAMVMSAFNEDDWCFCRPWPTRRVFRAILQNLADFVGRCPRLHVALASQSGICFHLEHDVVPSPRIEQHIMHTMGWQLLLL